MRLGPKNALPNVKITWGILEYQDMKKRTSLHLEATIQEP